MPSDAAYHDLPEDAPYDLLYITDSGNNRIVKAKQGFGYLEAWGSFGRGPGEFDYPVGIDTDEFGNVYVVDQGNHRVQKFNSGGDYLDEWGGLGSGPGQFNTPAGIAIYGDYVYVSDYENYRVQQFTLDGDFVRAWGEQGSAPGQFDKPGPVAVDGDGYVYVSDLNNHRVQKFTPDGDYYAEIGSGVEGFEYPTGLTVDPAGRVHVATASQIPRLWAIEIKRTTSPKVTRGFHIATEELQVTERILVFAGDREVPGQGGVRAMPLVKAMERLKLAKSTEQSIQR